MTGSRSMGASIMVMAMAAEGDVVDSAFGEGMAAEEAAEGEPAAAGEAVARDGDVGVFGAGGQKAAAAGDGGEEAVEGVEERGEETLVEA